MKNGSGGRLGSLNAGILLGWVSLATVSVVVLLAIVQPSPPRLLVWLLNPLLLLLAGVVSGIIGAALCRPYRNSDRRQVAWNGMIRGIGGAVLNALVLSLTTMTSVTTST